MALIDLIEKPKNRPPIITICGDPGLGKTSLAALFDKPIFIRAEDGLQSIPEKIRPDALPVIKRIDQLWEQTGALIKEDHDYQTLVVDSVTALERLFESHIVSNDRNDPDSINQACGGFGNGPKAVGALHRKLRRYCGMLNERKNMTIVFIAHADLEKMDLPDSDPYSRYSMRFNKNSIAVYLDDSDIVGFIKLKTFVKGDKDKGLKKAVSTGARVFVCHSEASSVSKNRYGINEEIEIKAEINPLKKLIPFFADGQKNEKTSG